MTETDSDVPTATVSGLGSDAPGGGDSFSALPGRVRLGPFELETMLGTGGMGEVWKATHLHRGVDVAVKIVTQVRAGDDSYQRHFRTEVRSIASLNHRSIVDVLHYGEVSRTVEESTRERFVAGTPYFAMELAERGSLRTFLPDIDWAFVRRVVTRILSALAHSHSRGIYHRDLKPSNVLFADPEETDGLRLKLSDFGLAFIRRQALSEIDTDHRTCGTPYFMAPEQFRGNWRNFGPHTDLYSLGCLCWEMTTGSHLFDGTRVAEIGHKHISEPIPDFEPTVDTPDRFENWLLRLLQKNRWERYQTAADALYGLERVDSPEYPRQQPEQTDERRPARGAVPESTLSSVDGLAGGLEPGGSFVQTTQAPVAETSDPPTGDRLSVRMPAPARPPPIPNAWRDRTVPSTSMNLVGAGLDLFELRDFPLIDRNSERDAIWGAFTEAVRADSPRLVLLKGSGGVGKTRLARWAREHAAELGAARQMRATHGPSGGPRDGLRPMIARFLECSGLGRERTTHRIEEWMREHGVDEPREWHALAELLHPLPDDADVPEYALPVHFSSASERYAAIHRFLQYASRERPLIVHLDDLQWGRSSLAFLDQVLDEPADEPLQCLFVGTVQLETLNDAARTQARLDSMADRDTVRTLDVAPLDSDDQRRLVENLLALHPSAAHIVADRSAGNPMYAIQLVADWIEREILRVDSKGFVLDEDADDHAPNDAYAVWSDRLETILSSYSGPACRALEVAAALGTNVQRREWRSACELGGLETSAELLENLVDRAIARESDSGWEFAHGMARETLEERARREGRLTSHHALAARMLEEKPEHRRDPSRYDRRLGEHRFRAGDFERALDPLIEAADRAGRHGETDRAHYLLGRVERAMDRADIEDTDPRRAEYHLRRGRLALTSERAVDDARDHYETARSAARARQLDEIAARAHLGVAQLLHEQSNYEGAVASARSAEDLLDPDGSAVTLGRAERAIGESLIQSGEIDDAFDELQRSRRRLAQRAPLERAKVDTDLARAHRNAGERDAAEDYLRAALETFEEQGSNYGRAMAKNALANLALEREEFDRAQRLVEAANRAARFSHRADLIHLEVGPADILARKGAYPEAVRRARLVLDQHSDMINPYIEAALRAILTHALAGKDEYADAGRNLETLRGILDEHDFVSVDIAQHLQAAQGAIETSSCRELEQTLADTAAEQWRQLDQPDRGRDPVDD